MHSFWPALSEENQRKLLELGAVRRFGAGSVILREGESSADVMVLLDGCVKVTSTDRRGRQATIGIRETGEVVGEMSTFTGGPRSATVRALQDVEALVVAAGWFNAFVRDEVDAAIALQFSFCVRLLESDRSRRSVVLDSAEQRVASVLISLSERHGAPDRSGGTLIDLPLSHEDIAGLTLTSCRSIDRVFHRLRADDVVVTGRRAILVKDVARLRARAA